MKKLFASVALVALAAGSGTALAGPSDSTEITVNGTVQQVCNIPSAPSITAGGASITGDENTSTVTLGELADPTTAELAGPGPVTVTFSDVICNYAANVGIKSDNGGLKHDGTVSALIPGSFAGNINYVGTATFGDATPGFTTAGASISDNDLTTGAAFGNLQIMIDLQDPGLPLLNGAFSDVITVAVGATV